MDSRTPILVLAAGCLAAACGVTNGAAAAAPAPASARAALSSPVLTSCAGIGDPDRPGIPWQDRPGTTSTFAIPAAMDTRAGRLVALEVPTSPDDRTVTWTFDVCTNTWRRMAPATSPPQGRLSLVYDEQSDVTLAVPSWEGHVWAYDLRADSWTPRADRKFRPASISDVTFDPDRRRVLAWSDEDASLWTYDVRRDVWQHIPHGPGVAWPDRRIALNNDKVPYTLMAFDSTVDAVVLIVLPVKSDAGSTWLLDAGTLTWTRMRSTPPFYSFGWFETGNEVAYDSANRRTMYTGMGQIALYDSATDTWTTSSPSGRPAPRLDHSLVFDSVNDRVILLGGESLLDTPYPASPWWVMADTWAYDIETDTWSRLVPPHQPPTPVT